MPTSSRPSSGRASGNAVTLPNNLPTLPKSTQLALPSNHLSPSMRTRVETRPTLTFLAPVKMYGLGRIVPSTNRRRRGSSARPKPAPAMTAKRSPLICPTSRRRRLPLRPNRDRGTNVLRYLEIRSEQVRGTGRDDRQCDIGPGHGVDAALHHAVAAPYVDQVGAGGQRLADALRCHLRFRHLEPQGIRNAGGRELVAATRPSRPRAISRCVPPLQRCP